MKLMRRFRVAKWELLGFSYANAMMIMCCWSALNRPLHLLPSRELHSQKFLSGWRGFPISQESLSPPALLVSLH